MLEEVPYDLSSSSNTIPPAPKPQVTTVSWSLHSVNKKSASDYERDRVEKYANYFKDEEILPIPELDDLKQLVLMGDWNAILDPKIDRVGRGTKKEFPMKL